MRDQTFLHYVDGYCYEFTVTDWYPGSRSYWDPPEIVIGDRVEREAPTSDEPVIMTRDQAIAEISERTGRHPVVVESEIIESGIEAMVDRYAE